MWLYPYSFKHCIKERGETQPASSDLKIEVNFNISPVIIYLMPDRGGFGPRIKKKKQNNCRCISYILNMMSPLFPVEISLTTSLPVVIVRNIFISLKLLNVM